MSSSSISYARSLEEESEDRVGVEGRYAVTIIAYRPSIRAIILILLCLFYLVRIKNSNSGDLFDRCE